MVEFLGGDGAVSLTSSSSLNLPSNTTYATKSIPIDMHSTIHKHHSYRILQISLRMLLCCVPQVVCPQHMQIRIVFASYTPTVPSPTAAAKILPSCEYDKECTKGGLKTCDELFTSVEFISMCPYLRLLS